MLPILLNFWVIFILYSKSISVSSTTEVPPFPYANEEGVIEDFRSFMPFAFASICNATWLRQKFPRGNSFEAEHPSTLVRGLSNSKGSAIVLYNDYLKSIIVSFKPTLTNQQKMQDMRLWRSSPFSLSSDSILEYFKSVLNPDENATGNIPEEEQSRNDTAEAEQPRNDTVDTDSDLLKKPFVPGFFIPKDAFLHNGFQNVYNSFRNDTLMITAMLGRRFPDYRIVFTGHSLGAAVAQIAAVDFSIQESKQSSRIWLITFASPRVGNKAWVDFVNQQEFSKLGHIQRLVRFRDPIPYLPPRVFGYRHTFMEHIIWDNLNITACPKRKRIFRLPWNPRIEDMPDSECSSVDPPFFEMDANFHLPRMYLSYLGLEFNCMAD